MDSTRRDLIAAALGVPVLGALAACSGGTSHAKTPPHPSVSPHPKPSHPVVHHSSYLSKPAPAIISDVPADVKHRQVALTIDDGVNADVVMGYARLAQRTGLRLTFFANGRYESWTQAAPILRPMIESGQIVVGNHTWSHPNLTLLSASAIAYQLNHNEAHLNKLFGHTTQPWIRPPYGYTNTRVRRVAASLGYQHEVMWDGTTGDDQIIPGRTIMKNLDQWMTPGQLVIGHANHPNVLGVFDQIMKLIHDRHLTTVTVADVWRP